MDLQDIIDQAIEGAIKDLGGPVPAEVRSYDAEAQTVECVPVVPLTYRGLVIEPPTLKDVPVVQPLAAAGGLVIPLQSGDVVQLVVQGWDIGGWLGGGDKQTDRRFSISDLVALPAVHRQGVSVLARSLTSPVLSGDPVLLGDSTAVDFVALAQLVSDQLAQIQASIADIIAKYNAHTHLSASGPFTTAPISSSDGEAMVIPYVPGAVAATKVKAK